MSISYCPTHHRFHDTDHDVECPECENEPRTILSSEPDGMGFYYGCAPGEFRQINVKRVGPSSWEIYVAGDLVGTAESKAKAETKALLWCSANPEAL